MVAFTHRRTPEVPVASGQESLWASKSAIRHSLLQYVASLQREQRSAGRPAQPKVEHWYGRALAAGDAGMRLQIALCERQSSF